MTQPNDPDEREANRLADAYVRGGTAGSGVARAQSPGIEIRRQCAGCEEDQTLSRKPVEQPTPHSPAGVGRLIAGSRGEPLPPSLRRDHERFFGADLGKVRIHTGPPAQAAAAGVSAQAFARGSDVFFARGRFDPRGEVGRHLLAHELAHTLQAPGGAIRRKTEHCNEETPQTAPAPSCKPSPGVADSSTTKPVVDAVGRGDVDAVTAALEKRTLPELKAIRTAVHNENKVLLERWLIAPVQEASWKSAAATAVSIVGALVPGAGTLAPAAAQSLRASGKPAAATANKGLSLLWPAIPLLERLDLYDEGYRELEQAQLEVICSTHLADRREALCDQTRLEAFYKKMDPPEEYEARLLIKPEDRYDAVDHFVLRAQGIVSDDEDPLFTAILLLSPADRKRLWQAREKRLQALVLDDVFADLRLARLKELIQGGEVQALIARLQLATERRKDDPAGVQAVVDRAIELFKERRTLQLKLKSPGLPGEERKKAQARIEELKDLDKLLDFQRSETGVLPPGTFMAMLAEARGAEGFGADVASLGAFVGTEKTESFAIDAARQRILLSAGDADAITMIIKTLHAPTVDLPPGTGESEREHRQHLADIAFRQKVLDNSPVQAAISGLKGSEQMRVKGAIAADAYDEIYAHALAALNGARWGEFFHCIFKIARTPAWKKKFEEEPRQHMGAASVFARAAAVGEPGKVMREILSSPTGKLPLARILAFSGDVELIRAAFADVGEEQRGQLRLGFHLAKQLPMGPPTKEQAEALKAYRDLEAQVRASQTTAGVFSRSGFEAVLVAVLGSEPTKEELATPEGRYQAAAIMYEQQLARRALGRGTAQYFSETDETMDAAAREFEALWLRLRDQEKLKMIDYSTLVALHQRFESRSKEFVDTSNMVGEMAGMVAATVAGIVVIAATGGTATPGVIALAAATGAGSRVVTREMLGGEYYKALSSEGARDTLLGAVDSALAVVGGQLAARGAELLGLGGHALTGSAARLAGEVTEQATQKLSTKVAASAVEGALDGAFSGSISEAFGTMTDARTWRRGIVNGLARVGQAALVGGLAGLGGGALAGAALSTLGHGVSWLRNAVAMQGLEKTLKQAGAESTLNAAREAALRGDLKTMSRLTDELEAHLTPDQARILREQLYADFTSFAHHPPGTVVSKEQEAILAKTAGEEDGATLTAAERKAETDVVAASEPQPSTVEGFVDEVDLGNQHVWRRQPDGTWCRFTMKTLCGTTIPGAKKMSEAELARVKAAQAALAQSEEFQAAARLERDLLERLQKQGKPLRIDTLSSAEREVLQGIIGEGEDLNRVTMKDVEEALADLRAEVTGRSHRTLPRAHGRVRQAEAQTQQAVYERLRDRSPTKGLRSTVIERARKTDPATGKLIVIDEVTGRPPRSGYAEADHVLSLKDVVELDGFARPHSRLGKVLSPEDQLAIANDLENLRSVDGIANSSRQNRTWEEWPQAHEHYTPAEIAKMSQLEANQRERLQAEIDAILAKRGNKP